MRMPFKARLLPAVLAGLLVGNFAWADEDMPETDAADIEVVESASEVPSGKIAGFFSDFLGGEEQSQAMVEGLRGGSISYQPPEDTGDGAEGDAVEDVADGDTDVDEVEGEAGEAAAGMGYGNVFITLALAEQLAMSSTAGEIGMTPEESLNEVLYLRQVEGMGWGRIAKELGVNLGEVISGIRSNRPDKVENAKAERVAEADKGTRSEKALKVERVDKVEKVAKLDRPQRPVKLERPEKVQRPEKVERPEKPARPERPSR